MRCRSNCRLYWSTAKWVNQATREKKSRLHFAWCILRFSKSIILVIFHKTSQDMNILGHGNESLGISFTHDIFEIIKFFSGDNSN